MSNYLKEDFRVRKATKDDMIAVKDMIQELADFEKMSNGPKLTVEDLIRDSCLDGSEDKEFFHCYIAEVIRSSSDRPLTHIPIGYAICFFSYSTWEGKSYFLEDLYVRPNYRKNGVGHLIFTEVVKRAKNFGCCRLDFHVLDWNPARKFYDKLGGIGLTETEGWQFYRMTNEQMDKLLNS